MTTVIDHPRYTRAGSSTLRPRTRHSEPIDNRPLTKDRELWSTTLWEMCHMMMICLRPLVARSERCRRDGGATACLLIRLFTLRASGLWWQLARHSKTKRNMLTDDIIAETAKFANFCRLLASVIKARARLFKREILEASLLAKEERDHRHYAMYFF